MLTLQTIRSTAAKINANVDKHIQDTEDTHNNDPILVKQMRDLKMQHEYNRVKRELLLIPQVIDIVKTVEEETGMSMLYVPESVKQTFFITIRPDTTKITFPNFKVAIFKLLKRKCFKDFTMSFEQKGLTAETYGDGFHTHIISSMTQRNKAQVIRDVYNTVKTFTAENCIDVKPCKNPSQVVQKYLVEYQADDEHKIITKLPDKHWRAAEGLKHIYKLNDIEEVLNNP